MLYLPFLVPKVWQENMAPKHVEGGELQGGTPWDGHTYCWGGNCANDSLWVVKVEVGGREVPLSDTQQLKIMYDCAPIYAGGKELVPVGWWNWIGGLL